MSQYTTGEPAKKFLSGADARLHHRAEGAAVYSRSDRMDEKVIQDIADFVDQSGGAP